ncbi:hypothetical protein CK203_083266 [Vitis vinifera]|uniref:Reverse transcriptase domain-containing protein n=1 Tax=Vitis vinifera TaxID=29760 RepID=A0A438CZR9_VITVI|nr:hypothetical protein CK203_083266 [Vitis vinifera]
MGLVNSEVERLEILFLEEEVFVAVLDLGKDKAPSLDDFTMVFWFFLLGCYEVPNKGGVEDLKDFRPINLMGSLYKLLAKVLANRLKRLKKNEGGVLCKLDIEKAYDHVNLKFLMAVFRKMDFGEKWIKWTDCLRINLEKSELIPVGRVHDIEDLALELGFKVGGLPSYYLGLPLGALFKSMVV